ncbi:MAG: hypothetical protein GF416_02725 [Candidatus Altiarchaeales archaeon]|nr:hypothetical protein [Candidatus Altiarchaeales archaeon]MBD3416034.1 hypothetical protein [Candidatus Altiarchaeales archaeon]
MPEYKELNQGQQRAILESKLRTVDFPLPDIRDFSRIDSIAWQVNGNERVVDQCIEIAKRSSNKRETLTLLDNAMKHCKGQRESPSEIGDKLSGALTDMKEITAYHSYPPEGINRILIRNHLLPEEDEK